MLEVFYSFLCIIIQVLEYENEQVCIRWKISRKYTYSGKDFFRKNLFCPEAYYK